MGNRDASDLGEVLVVVKPHPVSVLIGCVPGIVLAWAMVGSIGTDILLLFHPEVYARPGVRPFIVVSLVLTAVVLGFGLRHVFDRAEFCQEGFRFLKKSYRYDQMGPISWGHHSNNGLTRFYDTTTLAFWYQGKQVKLKTRYLQDMSYEYHRVYADDPTGSGRPAMSRPDSTNSTYRPRPR